MSVSASTAAKISEVAPHFRTASAGDAERMLTEILETAVDGMRCPLIIKTKLTCRGCGRPMFTHTETVDRTPIRATTLNLTVAIDPHICEKQKGGLF